MALVAAEQQYSPVEMIDFGNKSCVPTRVGNGAGMRVGWRPNQPRVDGKPRIDEVMTGLAQHLVQKERTPRKPLMAGDVAVAEIARGMCQHVIDDRQRGGCLPCDVLSPERSIFWPPRSTASFCAGARPKACSNRWSVACLFEA
jgi:hypothetical protein